MSLPRRVEIAATACALLCCGLGALAFLGWWFDLPLLKSLGRSFSAVKANAALGLMLIGAALSLGRAQAQRWRTALAAAAMLLAAVTLLEYSFDWNAGIDELLFRDSQPPAGALAPGRMSPATAATLLCLATAIICTAKKRGPVARSVGQGLGLLAAFFALLTLIGYLYGVETFYRVGPFVSVSLPSACGFLACGLALLLSDATFPLAKLFGSESGAGAMLRRLVPAAIVIPVFLGWLRLEGQRIGLYDTSLGLALLVSSNVVCFTGLVWWNGKTLGRAEVVGTEAALRLRALADASRAFAAVATDYEQLLESVVASASELIGDGCLITLIAADGETLLNAANAHRDPSVARDYRDYLALAGTNTLHGKTVAAAVARTGEARLVPSISPETVVAQSEEKLRHLVRRLNVHGFVVVPIRAQARIIGTLSLLRSRPGQPYSAEDVTLLQDLADRAGLAIENARLYAHLERRVEERTLELAAVNQELEAFSYSVAHDLKAPLRAIVGFSVALSEDLPASSLDQQSKRHLELLLGNAEQMTQLIDALLALSRITRAEVQASSVDLGELARAVARDLTASDPEREVTFVVAERLETQGDPLLLSALLQNLLGNSWKFTRHRPQPRIEIGKQGVGREAIFFVRDNGVGFSMAHADKLFAPFQRLHSADQFEGTGIGLATVQRIVRRHGGRIWAESDEQAGATFYFTLPGPEPSSSAPGRHA